MSRAEAGCARPRKGVSRLDSNGRTEKDHKMNVEVSQKIAEVLSAARQRHEKLSPRQELKRRAEQALKAAKYRGASPGSRKRYDLEKTLEDRAMKALSEAVARASCTADAQPQPTQLSGLRAPPHSVPWGGGHRYEADNHLPWLQEEAEMTEDATAWNMEIDHGHSGHAIEDYAGYDAWAEGNDPMVDGYADGMAATWDVQETSSWAGQGSSFFAHGAFPHGAVQGYMAMDEQPSRWTSKPPLRARSEETEVLRTWAETTTAASSTRSVASAADSNSETGPVNDDDDADELLASCWKAVAEAAEV